MLLEIKQEFGIESQKKMVNNRVKNFLNEHEINDCYEYRETDTNLLLKCMINGILTDISIDINPIKRINPLHYYSVSVSI